MKRLIKRIPAIIVFFSLVLPLSAVLAKNELKVKSVVIDGNNVFSDKRLSRLMLTKPAGFLSRTNYFPAILEDDINNLTLFYQNNGYLDVQIEEPVATIDSLRNEVDIKIAVNEGELTRVEGISVFGNTVFSDSILLQMITAKPQDPFRRSGIQDGMLAIVSAYADKGYLDANVKPEIKINRESYLAVIDLIVTENDLAMIEDIRVVGLEKTREYVVRRELTFKPGQAVSYSRLLESQRNLYLTGLFESVFVRPIPSDTAGPGKKIILVEIKEKLSGEMNIAVGYGSVDRIRGRFEILNNNIYGTALQAGMSLNASVIRRSVEGSFTEPRTLGFRIKSDLNLKYEYLLEPGYDLGRITAQLTLGKTLRKNSQLGLTYKFEEAALKNVEVSQIPATIDSRTRSLTLSLVYDTRDNLFNPRRGHYIQWTNEMAGAFLHGNNTFMRSILNLRKYYSYNPQTIVASSIEIGWMDYFGSSADIPLNERFYAGGPNSIRGFGYQLIGPLESENVPLGGRFKLVWNILEVRRAIYKILGCAVFVDMGNVWPGIKDFNVKDLRASAGPGLRANTPLGMVRLDLGINLAPKQYESSKYWHFNIGHSF